MGGQALPYPRGQYFNAPPAEILIVGLDTDDGPEHVLWQERAQLPVDDGLARDIGVRGVLEPVGVRKDGDRLLCVYGRQRVKAARKAGVKAVPVIIVRDDDHGVLLAALAENAHRQDNDQVLCAKEARRAIAVHKAPISDVAQAMGKSVPTINSWLAYFDLDRRVQKAVESGRVSFTSAVELAPLSRDDQRKKLDELIAAGGTITVARARAAKAQARGERSRSQTPHVPPNKRLLRKIVERGEEHNVPKSVITTLRWVVGEVSGANIPGLTPLLRTLEQERKKK